MKAKHLMIIASLVLAAGHARPQSMDVLVEEGLKNNPQLRSFDFQIEAASFRADAVQALPAPTFALEAAQVPVTSINLLDDALSQNLSLSQMFMLGGKLSAMSEVEKRRGKVLEENRGARVARLRADIKMTYAQLWLLDRQAEVQRKTIALLEELARSMVSQVQTNKMRLADLLTLQAEVAVEEARLLNIRLKRETTQNALRTLLGRDDIVTHLTTDSMLAPPTQLVTETRLVERVQQVNPRLVAMDRMKEMNEAEIASAKKELFPDLMIQAMAMRMPNGMILTTGSRSVNAIQQSAMGMPMQKTEWMYSLMVSVTLPFAPWSAERSSAKAEEVRAMNSSIDADREDMRREMILSLRSAMARYVTADSLSRRYATAILPLLREAAEAQTTAYMDGRTPLSTVLDARKMELMKEDDSFMASAERQMALAELEMMVGEPLR